MTPSRRQLTASAGPLAVVAVVVVLIGLVVVRSEDADTTVVAPEATKQIVIGEVEAPPPVADRVEGGPGVETVDGGGRLGSRGEPQASGRLRPPDGTPPGPPVPFRSSHPPADGLTFVLVAGSDARPGEPVTRTRADSLHVVAVDPSGGRGTIVGIPRDAWVDIPGHGSGKINSALALGGPQLLARTVTDLTGMPIRWYVITGFDGLVALTNDLGGVAVHVDRRMDDRASGAHFDRGWHHFDGGEALAFARDRNDTEYGDFSRSLNQGVLMLATLVKMRTEIGDEGGLARWLGALRDHVHLDIGMDDLFALGVTARRLDPRRVANVVASGTVGRAGGQSVVFLDDDARRLFADVAEDGVMASPPPPYDPPGSAWESPTTTTTTTTTTTAPVTTTVMSPRTTVTTTTTTSPTTSTVVPVGR